MRQGNFLKIPETGDRGNVFSPAISDDLDTLDKHNHDGITSPTIKAKSIEKNTINIVNSGWINNGTDFYQEVTLPTGYDFDTTTIKAIINSGPFVGSLIFPTIIKTTPTKFNIFCMYGNLDLLLVIS